MCCCQKKRFDTTDALAIIARRCNSPVDIYDGKVFILYEDGSFGAGEFKGRPYALSRVGVGGWWIRYEYENNLNSNVPGVLQERSIADMFNSTTAGIFRITSDNYQAVNRYKELNHTQRKDYMDLFLEARKNDKLWSRQVIKDYMDATQSKCCCYKCSCCKSS